MSTTIQVSENLQTQLKERKLSEGESYEDVIWDMIEDVTEISEETKKLLRQAEQDVKEGKIYTIDEIKREFNV